MRAFLAACLLLAGCTAAPPRDEPPPVSALRMYEAGYAHAAADARARARKAAAARAEARKHTTISLRESKAPGCAPPGNGLIRDRRATAAELRRELDRVLRLYAVCAARP